MMGVVLAGGAMFAVGLIDDVRDMSAPAKMAGQVLAASILYFTGVTLWQFKIPLAGFYLLSPGVIPLITALWVICLTNAVNLIDGLDGLAAGVVAIGGGALAIYGVKLIGLGLLPADNIGPLVATIACGICLGFLPFNFNPARIFMGDAGALFLGLLMAASTMVIGGRVPDVGADQRRDLLLLRAPVHPPADPGRAVGRHGVRLRAPHGARQGLRHAGQGAHPSPPGAPRPRPPEERAHPVGVHRDSVGLLAFPTLRPPGERLHPARRGGARRGPLHLLPPGTAARRRDDRGRRAERTNGKETPFDQAIPAHAAGHPVKAAHHEPVSEVVRFPS